jgi:Mg2+ and Co2+ transporter CorA
MRVFQIGPTGVQEIGQLPAAVAPQSTVWISCSRAEFDTEQGAIQATLQTLCGIQLVDLHVSDLLNAQLPSHYDYTAQYDLLVFRRLASATAAGEAAPAGTESSAPARRTGPPILRRIDTSPVGFAVFDNVLLSVHPVDCAVRDAYAQRLLSGTAESLRDNGSRIPTSAADLMLRIVSQIVDRYLDLRRELSRQLDHWQAELLAPNARFTNWSALLDARLALHALDDVAEEQRTAIQDWTAALETWPPADTQAGQREHDLLKVRSRDVLEHIERVVRHVRRLEQNAETTVQMHFSAQGHRTNEIMRTLTVLTAVFLPLNLITGFFGMNFDFLPLIHSSTGFWIAFVLMIAVGGGLILLFWRKRYLGTPRR